MFTTDHLRVACVHLCLCAPVHVSGARSAEWADSLAECPIGVTSAFRNSLMESLAAALLISNTYTNTQSIYDGVVVRLLDRQLLNLQNLHHVCKPNICKRTLLKKQVSVYASKQSHTYTPASTPTLY